MVFPYLKQLVLLHFLAIVSVRAQMNVQSSLGFQVDAESKCRAACTSLVSVLGEKVYFEEQPASWFQAYYSSQQRDTVPACIVLPASTEDVSEAIKVINRNECIFAVKSGGHALFSGSSSAPNGITLDLRYLNDIQISKDHSTAFIGPGNRWGDVYDYLDPINITVVGGRDAQVGVGGFLLGGGISFISRRFGWGADNVKNYEVVLANGTISSITRSTDADLYWALRGGGNNFGVVTRFDLETYPQAPMWGGFDFMLLSDVNEKLSILGIPRPSSWTMRSLLEQASDYINHLACRFGYCTTIDTFARMLEKLYLDTESDLYAQAYGYIGMLPYANTYAVGGQLNHGRALANASVYGDFLAIRKLYSTHRVATPTDFSREVTSNNAEGRRQIYETASFKISSALLVKVMEIFMSETESIRNVRGVWPSLIMQTVSRAEISHFSKNGGNAFGISEEDGPLLLLSTAIAWEHKSDDEVMIRASKNIIDGSVAIGKEMGLHHRYIYQNYAAKHQDVFEGYGPENRKRLQEIQKKNDPEGIFSRLQPGYFKV